MKKLGFHDSWICLITRCITYVSYSVLINGVAFGNIIPSRDLRQGDPLSPYLFLLCADGFSSLIIKAVRNQMLSGLSIYRGCPKITHLFFADDSLLFCKANSQECQQLIEILCLYEAASGQKINADKSSVFYSANTLEEKKNEILEILGPMQDSRYGKYLGLPSIIGKSKNEVFAKIKERVGRKLAGWKEKILSIGGRETLIKAVVQAIPTYAMSCFQLPKGLCDDIEGMMKRFWWGQRGQESRIAWGSWKHLCKSKLRGGMGFRNLQAFNLAMLAKQGWRLLMNPNSLVARVYRAKYYAHGDVLNASLGSRPSYAWRTIMQGLEVVRGDSRWRVGNGKLIHIWNDKWLPTPTTYRVVSPPCDMNDFLMVSALIDHDLRSWKANLVKSIFLPFEADTILNIPISYNLSKDKLIWVGNRKGVFTVRSSYHVALNLVDCSDEGESSFGDPWERLWKKIWHLNIPPKIKYFAWRACIDALPTKVNLCPCCGSELEAISHSLICCEVAKRVWDCWDICVVEDGQELYDVPDIALQILDKRTTRELKCFLLLLG